MCPAQPTHEGTGRVCSRHFWLCLSRVAGLFKSCRPLVVVKSPSAFEREGSGLAGNDRLRVGRGTARADDAQGTPIQSHISPCILVYEDKLYMYYTTTTTIGVAGATLVLQLLVCMMLLLLGVPRVLAGNHVHAP